MTKEQKFLVKIMSVLRPFSLQFATVQSGMSSQSDSAMYQWKFSEYLNTGLLYYMENLENLEFCTLHFQVWKKPGISSKPEKTLEFWRQNMEFSKFNGSYYYFLEKKKFYSIYSSPKWRFNPSFDLSILPWINLERACDLGTFKKWELYNNNK